MHLPVLVILDKEIPAENILFEIEEMLRPYDENATVEPYVSLTRQEAIDKYRKDFAALYAYCMAQIIVDRDAYIKSHMPGHAEFVEKLPEILQLGDEAIWEYVKDEYSPFDLDEAGNVMSIENPMSKWDWWQRGGRFKQNVLNTDGLYEGDELRTRGVESCRRKNLKAMTQLSAIVSKKGEWHDVHTVSGIDVVVLSELNEDERSDAYDAFDHKVRELLMDADPEDLLTIVDVNI